MKKSIRILIAHNQALLIDSMLRALPEIYVIDQVKVVETEAELKKALASERFQLILSDVRFNQQSTLELFKLLVLNYPELKILLLTSIHGEAILNHFIKTGVHGIFNLTKGLDELRKVLEILLLEGRYYPSRYYANLIELLYGKPSLPEVAFNPREQAVLISLSKGWSSKRIAYELDLKENTVNCYRERLMLKTKTLNVAGLISFSYENGILGM